MQRELTEVVKVITGKIESKPLPWLVNHRRDLGYQLVNSIAISPDGTQTVSGSDDGTVAIWDAQTGNLLRKIEGHINRVRSVALSPDGIQIASGSSDRTVAIWDAQTGSLFRKLDGHRGGVNSVAFSPDGAQIASGSSDRTVAIWDVQTGNLLRRLGHTNWVESAFSPEGTQVASQAGSDNRTAAIWDAQRPQRGYPQSLQIDTNWVTSVAFSPDGTQIASSFFDGSVTIWDAQTGKLLRTIKGHTNWLNAFSLDGYWVQSTDNPNIALFWELEMLQEVESSSAYMFSKSVVKLSDHHWFLDGRWIMRIFHRKTQYVCFLMYQDITAHAFYKSSCILGTRSGHIYILDLSACRYPE
ncbi:hypothetical protein FRC03_001957 [Tulasnella sp. 419]|nr:hypothetical protein FRC03_001957 [Tulasnella sp. 419]